MAASNINHLTEKLNGVTISNSKSNAWSSPSANPLFHSYGSPAQSNGRKESPTQSNGSNGSVNSFKEEESGSSTKKDNVLAAMSRVRRKKDFKCMERVKGRLVNVLQGLELHTGVFNDAEQKRIVDYVYALQEQGRNGKLRERTYSEPRKWMRGKGRVTLQFGCCYNYAMDKDGNPPGILRDEEVDPLPPLLKSMIKRMVEWRVLPPTCIPNSCIINIYDKDDCIPPHIDHHDFVRPFCTVSFLSECNILFGADLKILGPGEFSGSTAIPLPLGSVLILNGNGADVAKHCVPAVPSKRISITFRKMDVSKMPFHFTPDPELQNLKPLPLTPNKSPVQNAGTPPTVQNNNEVSISPAQQLQNGGRVVASPVHTLYHTPQPRQFSSFSKAMSAGDINKVNDDKSRIDGQKTVGSFQLGDDDFPALGSSSFSKPVKKPGQFTR